MSGYYRNRVYVPTYVPRRDDLEYPGYNHSWVIGQHGPGLYYDADEYHRTPRSSTYQYYPRSRSQRSFSDHGAELAWPTEIPVRLRVTLCCEGCKTKLAKKLRNLDGVHDVGIRGWNNAMVTVTGTASSSRILKTARKISSSAEFWRDDHCIDDDYLSHGSYRRQH